MKRTIFAGLGIMLPMLAISLISRGQAATGLRFSNSISSAENSLSKAAPNTLSRGGVNARAVKDFERSYKNVSTETWFEVPDGLVAKFAFKGVDYRVDYDKKGNWLHTIRTYDESEFPADLRAAVKSTYYDYNISVVQEIEQPRNNFTYIVHLEGRSTLIYLRIHDGDIEEWQKFKKSE